MDTEKIAIAAVMRYVAQCNYLSPYLNSGDKEPSWDGNIYIYENELLKKDSIKRIPVQIKGKQCKNLPTGTIEYSVALSDLENYMNDSGVLFLVVYIGGNREEKIFYRKLYPITLKRLISEANAQKTMSIKLEELTLSYEEFVAMLKAFHKDRLMQASFVHVNAPVLEELIAQGILESITLSAVLNKAEMINPVKAFLNSEFIYVRIKGGLLPLPIEMSAIDFRLGQVVKIPVTIGNVVIYTELRATSSKKENIVEIGQSIQLRVTADNLIWQIQYKLKGSLRDQIQDMDFILKVLREGSFNIGNMNFKISIAEFEKKGFDYKKHEKLLFQYQKTLKLLDTLGIKKDLDLSRMNNEAWAITRMLITAFVDNEVICGVKQDLLPVIFLEISNLYIVLATEQTKEKGCYLLKSFQETSIPIYIDRCGEMHPVSKYSIFQKKQFAELSNIDFMDVVTSIKEFGDFLSANVLLLEMILAYDIKPIAELKLALGELSEWIFKWAPDSLIPYGIRLLNRLQVIRRSRELNHEEVADLLRIIESKEQDEEVLLGAYLLLDNLPAAKIHFDNLSEEKQAAFSKYPIFRFFKTEVIAV